MMNTSLCGLGQRTPGPVMAALRFFEHEFQTHIDDGICAAGQCKMLVRAKCINTLPGGRRYARVSGHDRTGALRRGAGDPPPSATPSR